MLHVIIREVSRNGYWESIDLPDRHAEQLALAFGEAECSVEYV